MLGKTASTARILSPKQTTRTLPFLLIQSFFYAVNIHTVYIVTNKGNEQCSPILRFADANLYFWRNKSLIAESFYFAKLLAQTTELKITEWKTTVDISSSSQSSIATLKNVLPDGRLTSSPPLPPPSPVRPKKGSYTPVIRNRNQIQRIPTTGLWGSYANTVLYTKQKTYV